MANGNGNDMTKADLQDVCDQVTDILADAYQPEASRETLASAIGDALDLLAGDTGTPPTMAIRTMATTTRTDTGPRRARQGKSYRSRLEVSCPSSPAGGRKTLRFLWIPPGCPIGAC